MKNGKKRTFLVKNLQSMRTVCSKKSFRTVARNWCFKNKLQEKGVCAIVFKYKPSIL